MAGIMAKAVEPQKAPSQPHMLIPSISQPIQTEIDSEKLIKTWAKLHASIIRMIAIMQISVLINRQKTIISLVNLYIHDWS